MSKFRFKLEKVLQHRKVLEDMAQRDLEEAVAQLISLENQVQKYHESITTARETAYQIQTQGGNPGPALSQIDSFIKGQEVRIERENIKIKEQQSLVENLREILRQKAIDYKILEELREKKKQEFVKEQNRLEQKENDEMNSMRFGRG
jgi:flagellar FliJ protein